MQVFKSLFQSQDSKYFIKTALKVLTVPIISSVLMVYSLWLYMEMNYSFFLANGFATGPEMKEAFFDHLMSTEIQFIPWVGLFYVSVFFIGLFLAQLVLRPFDQSAKMCQELAEGGMPNTNLDPMSAKKLVNRSVIMLVNFLYASEKGEHKDYQIPQDLTKVKKPEADMIFYIQYGAIVFILAVITAISCYFFINHMHEAIIDSAMKLLKANSSIRTFLTSQSDMMEMMVGFSSAISTLLYIWLAKGIIADVQGVSYGYLRDIRDIVSGQHNKRLRPRFSDPGKAAANEINDVLDLYFPEEEKSSTITTQNVIEFKPHISKDVPPAFIEAFKSKDGEAIYRVVTSDGEVVEGLNYQQASELIGRAS